MAKALWSKGTPVNERMQQLCMGNDQEIDRALITDDCVGSAAHARMLQSVGLISPAEGDALVAALAEIYVAGVRGSFAIGPLHEDVHTAIEFRLVEQLQEVGKKIHTGRSRNDQVLTALRIQHRRMSVALCHDLLRFASQIELRFAEVADIAMPGYTHQQPAMPSTVGFWLHGNLESLLVLLRAGEAVLQRLDCSPLGASAGFGSSLPIDRECSARLLGFSRVQRSSHEAMNSRGWYELLVVHWCSEIALVLEKFAQDMAFGLLRETGFFTLDEALCTGSSIMPQKRNPDLVELLRGKAAKVRGAYSEIQAIVAKLPSSYHRDFQYTKEPFLRALTETSLMLEMAGLALEHLQVNRERCEGALYDELFATYEANRLVREGMPFREAYRAAADRHAKGQVRSSNYSEEIEGFRRTVRRDFELAKNERLVLQLRADEQQRRLASIVTSLFPMIAETL